MTPASPNFMVWTYFQLLRRIVQRIPGIRHEGEQKDEVVLALYMAVSAVDVFTNVYFGVLADNPKHEEHRDFVLKLLNPDEPSGFRPGVRRKLKLLPPKLFKDRCLKWQKGIAKEFEALCDRRNALTHFTSSRDTVQVAPGVVFAKVPNIDVYHTLTHADAVEALRIAEGMVAEIMLVSGVPPEQIPACMHLWTAKPTTPVAFTAPSTQTV